MEKTEKRPDFSELDDDGEKTMVWVDNGGEREKIGVERVINTFLERPWIDGEITLTEANSYEDEHGIDMFVPMQTEMLAVLGIWSAKDLGVPVQVKSSLKEVRDFLKKKKMIRDNKPIYRDGLYTFTLNGTDAKLLVLADLVGQMMAVAMNEGSVKSEEEFLAVLEMFGDREAVEVWSEQKEVVLDTAWYRELI